MAIMALSASVVRTDGHLTLSVVDLLFPRMATMALSALVVVDDRTDGHHGTVRFTVPLFAGSTGLLVFFGSLLHFVAGILVTPASAPQINLRSPHTDGFVGTVGSLVVVRFLFRWWLQ
jgi:hypothetical protein